MKLENLPGYLQQALVDAAEYDDEILESALAGVEEFTKAVALDLLVEKVSALEGYAFEDEFEEEVTRYLKNLPAWQGTS